MNAEAFNRSLERSRARAEERHLAAARTAYERLIRRSGRAAGEALRAQSVTAAANWQPPPEGVLFQLGTAAPAAAAALANVHKRIVAAVAGPPLERIGIAWDVAHPLTAELLEQAGKRTGERLGEAVQPVLREAVAQAYAEGLSVPEAADLIRDRIEEAADWQASMLARTDLNGLANGGSVLASKLAGIETKTWLTAADERVRPEHNAANGQTVPIDQPFQVCGEALQWPGDPAGSDGCVINCRCSVLFGETAARTAAADEGETMSQTAAVTITVDEEPAAAEGVTVAWVSDIAFEGAATEDGRYILPDALEWREPPLTLMAMTETGPGGHEGAFVAGRMDTFEKVDDFDIDGDELPEGVIAVRSLGVFDMGGDNGRDVARLVEEKTVRGISVDLAVQEWVVRDPETGEIFDPNDLTEEQMERFFFGELQQAVQKATIMAATVCPTPAFAEARIALTASGARVLRLTVPFRIGAAVEPLTAAAAGLAPVSPPREWFETPEAEQPTALTVTKDGQVFGHMALWDSCHTGYPGQCVPPPRSPSGYAYFNLGEVECDDGSRVSCGAITLETLHADTSKPVPSERVKAHYENTGTVAAYVRATDGKHGIWVAGALRPGLSEQHARDLMGAKPSGDWRPTGRYGPLEMIGVLAVNVPGYPVPRLVASALLPSGGRAELAFYDSDAAERDTQTRIDVLAAQFEDDPVAALAELV